MENTSNLFEENTHSLVKKDQERQTESKKFTVEAHSDINIYKGKLKKEERLQEETIRDSEAVRIMKKRAENYKELEELLKPRMEELPADVKEELSRMFSEHSTV